MPGFDGPTGSDLSRSPRSYRADVRRPGVANLSRRDRAAWTAARWVCVLHPCAATASRSRFMPSMKPGLPRLVSLTRLC